MTWWVSVLAGIVAAAFTYLVAQHYRQRGAASDIAWGLGLAFYALASFIEAAVALWGWSVPLYRIYFPMAAALVGLLGLGTLLLLRRPRVSQVATVVTVLLIVLAVLGQFTEALSSTTVVTSGATSLPLSQWGPSLGDKAIPLSNPGRIAGLLLNILGGLALIGGAIASWWQHRARGVLLIGIGALFPFVGGSAGTLFAADTTRILFQLVGIVVMFVGYVYGSRAAAVAREPVPAPTDL